MSEQTRGEKFSTPRIIRGISVLSLTIYIAVLFWQTFIHAYGSYERFPQGVIEFNLIPFKTVLHYMQNFNQFNLNVWFFNLIGNVIAFVPFGFLLPCTAKRLNYLWKVIILTLLISLFIEVIQLVFRIGVFDIDDMILNTAGGTIGYFIKQLISKMFYVMSYH